MNRKDIAELMGLVAIVASLVFVGMQLRQAQDIAIAEGFTSHFSSRIEVANNIKEDMVIWKKGTAGADLEEDESAIFETLLFQLDANIYQGYFQALVIDGEKTAKFSAQEFARFLYHNPGARKAWLERAEYLDLNRGLLMDNFSPEPYHEIIHTSLLKLDRAKPPINEKAFVYW
jgi:hypothetical protein